MSEPKSLLEVREREAAAIARARKEDGVASSVVEDARSYVGLALSGGGIRSATFNLGILQALARFGLLRRIDYLSCVSGGNYIGTWLSSLIHRKGGKVVEAEGILAQAGGDSAAGAAEPREVTYLRSYSNYLAPNAGGFTVDTWTGIATYLRNLTLNQSLLVLFLASLLLLPQLIGLPFQKDADAEAVVHAAIAALVLVAIAVICIGRNMASMMAPPASAGQTPRTPFITTELGVVLTVLLPGVAGAVLLAWAMHRNGVLGVAGPIAWGAGTWTLGGVAFYGGCWLLAGIYSSWRSGKWRDPWRWWVVVAAPFAGIVLGGVLHFVDDFIGGAAEKGAVGGYLAAALGPVLMVTGAFSLTIAVHIGLAKRAFREEEREWWGRLGAWAMLFTLAWLALFAAIWIGPAFFEWATAWAAALGIGWIATTAWGVVLGAGDATGGKRTSGPKELFTKAAPSVFVIGALVVIAVALHSVLDHWATPTAGAPSGHELLEACTSTGGEDKIDKSHAPPFAPCLEAQARRMASVHGGVLAVALGVALGLAAVLGWRIDVNLFSFHQFYRNRLMRCYLGATRSPPDARKPHAFTRFDPDDDLSISGLAARGGQRPADAVVQRPYHLVNTALNIAGGGKHLAWQQRQACSFTFTPLYCGFEFPPSSEVRAGGWISTREYMARNGKGGPMLGSLMAVSGAAASPNGGYHTSPQVAFLLALFNVRLGRWCPTPGTASAADLARESPQFGAGYLLKELLAAVNEESPYVYLSDGGHFENLGVYELVRRRCTLIVACDGSADPELGFEDLGNAIRKCRIDLGVDITLRTDEITREAAGKPSRWHCAVGEIDYRDGGSKGTLVYVKASLTGDEPMDVREYAGAHPAFPHEPTADQFFDESQFESYRRLGLHVGEMVFGCLRPGEGTPVIEQCAWVTEAEKKLATEWRVDERSPAKT